MKKIFFILFLLIIPLSSHSYLAEKIVGRVGESFISLSSFRLYKKRLRAGLVFQTTLFNLENKQSLLSSNAKLISFMTKNLMIDQIAKKVSFEPSAAQVDLSLKQIKKNLSHTAFSKKLSQQGYSLKSFRAQLRQDLKKDFIIRQAVFSKIKISENDINSYYFSKTKQPLYTSFEYDIAFISFPKTDLGLAKAKKVLRAVSKTSFEQATSQFSVEKKVLKSSQLDPSMEKALKPLSVSKTSSLVPIQNRIYIFKLLWKTPVLSASKERVKQKLEALLIEKEAKKELEKWLKNQQKHFFITTNPL